MQLLYDNNCTQLQNLGPIWKLLCCAKMEVDVPMSAVVSILNEHEDWEKSRKRRSKESHLHKRIIVVESVCS